MTPFFAAPSGSVLDAHIHLPSEGWRGGPSFIATVKEALSFLKASGVGGAVFTTYRGVFAKTERDLEMGNAEALKLAEKHAGILLPGLTIHPRFPRASRRWLARFREQGFFWVGELVHYVKAYRYTDARFLDLCAECEAYGHILQAHGHEDLLEVARRFPRLRLVFAHVWGNLLPQLAKHPRVWQDLSGAAGLRLGEIEAAIKVFGRDRLLFGTDFTIHDPRCLQERLRSAVPHAADRRRILGNNLRQLLAEAGRF